MATTLMYKCQCGKIYNVYIPKKAIARYMEQSQGDIEAAGKLDQVAKKCKEMEVAKRVARITKTGYIDLTEKDEFKCSCERNVDINHILENFCRTY